MSHTREPAHEIAHSDVLRIAHTLFAISQFHGLRGSDQGAPVRQWAHRCLPEHESLFWVHLGLQSDIF